MFTKVAAFFSRLFCRHEGTLSFVRNIHGDEINHLGGRRSEWKCSHCDRYVYKWELNRAAL